MQTKNTKPKAIIKKWLQIKKKNTCKLKIQKQKLLLKTCNKLNQNLHEN